jgi:hypothetical protein
MTTRSLPDYLLKAVPNIALASTDYLCAYASLMLLTVETRDGQIGETRAQLTLLNERLTAQISSAAFVPQQDLEDTLTALQDLRDALATGRPAVIQGAAVADDLDRLFAIADAMTEVARRAARREPLVNRIMATRAA